MKQNLPASTLFACCLVFFSAGAPLASDVEISPSEYDFAEVEIGSSSTVIVSLTNTGLGPTDIHWVEFWEGSSPDFSVSVPVTLPFYFDGLSVGPVTGMGGIAYFQANDDAGTELWRTDGSPDGTFMVIDINPELFPSLHVEYLTTVNDMLFFVADDGIVGPELWTSDGTAAGTILIKDTHPGYQSGRSPNGLTAFDGFLFFLAEGETPGRQLWRSDGTEEGTFEFLDIVEPETSRIGGLRDLGGTLYFTVDRHGYSELWKTDGTAAGTERVSDTQFESISTYLGVNVGDTAFFTAIHDSGQELWKSNAAGTALVKDIYPGQSPTGQRYSSRPFGLTPFDDRLFFHADDGVHGRELWTSDGTEGGTSLFKEIRPGAERGVCGWIEFALVFDGALFFAADDGSTGCELWTSDGTAAGTLPVTELVPGPEGSSPAQFAVAGDTLFFTAWDPDHGRELWASDGTAAGTRMLKDICTGAARSQIYDMTHVGGTLYFGADDCVSGYELWKSDGTEAGTMMVKEINPGIGTTVHLEVTFAPTIPGPAEAMLYIAAPASSPFVPFTGVGVYVVPPPDEQIAEVLEYVEESVTMGTLSGDGPGRSAEGRLNALINMIEAAGHLFAGGQLDEACRQLRDAYNRCDGEPHPPDFVSGDSSTCLADMILEVMFDQGCVD